MFAIALKADRYSTYVLSDAASRAQLEVVPERGGLITRWRIDDQDILYFDAERFANPDLSVRGGIPLLFPICGNLPENQYSLNGQAYELKQHGFARDLPWRVVHQEAVNAASLTLELASNEVTRAHYPFDFRLSFTYLLQGQSLELQQKFTNLSDRPMPFATGLHPYFAVSDKSQLSFDIPATEFRNHLTGDTESFAGEFDFAQPEIDLAFQGLSATTATVTDHQLGRQLTLSWSAAYTKLVFWTVSGKDYYCLEPWSAPRNALNTGEDLLTLAPQQTMQTSVRLDLTFL